MKKYIPVVAVVLLLLIGGGVFLASRNKTATPGAVNTSVSQDQNQDGNVFTSIKDALSKSLSLECTYNDDEGSETKTFIKGGAVRAESKIVKDGSETNSYVIFRDKKMYSWDAATKKGVVLEVPEQTTEDTQSLSVTPGTGISQDNRSESFLAEIEKYKDACKPAVVSAEIFTPPADVEFQDLSQLMQNIPTGSVPENGSPPSFNYEDLMKQYAAPKE